MQSILEILSSHINDIIIIIALYYFITATRKKHQEERTDWYARLDKQTELFMNTIRETREVINDNTSAIQELVHVTHGMNIVVTSFLHNSVRHRKDD